MSRYTQLGLKEKIEFFKCIHCYYYIDNLILFTISFINIQRYSFTKLIQYL